MRIKIIASALALQLAAVQAAPVTTPHAISESDATNTSTAAAAPVVTSDWAERSAPRKADIIRQSVRESIAAHDAEAREHAEPVRRHEQDTLRADVHETFDQRMEEARTPGCLRPDGLKNQPTGFGPFQLGGLMASPFIIIAALRGKCN